MHIVLLSLDAVDPVDADVLNWMRRFVEAFFCMEMRVLDVPKTAHAARGWEALRDGTHCPLKARDGHPGAWGKQLYAPHLLECLKQLRDGNCEHHVEGIDGANSILGFTACELFLHDDGLLPDVPVSMPHLQNFFYGSSKEHVGVCSLAQLDYGASRRLQANVLSESQLFARTASAAPPSLAKRKFFRKLLKLVCQAIVHLLGLHVCQSQRCLAYWKPFDPELTHLNLCAFCEKCLICKAHPHAELNKLIEIASSRYSDMRQVLLELGADLGSLRIGHRMYMEFEEECTWLQLACEIMLESAEQRRNPVVSGERRRRRSLLHCLQQAHKRQPPALLHRVLSQPLLRRTCLLDMTLSGPYRHESGDLGRWCEAIINRKHIAGGHYVELGGSLAAGGAHGVKAIAGFVDAGLNASMVDPSSTLAGQRAVNFRRSADIDFDPSSPKIGKSAAMRWTSESVMLPKCRLRTSTSASCLASTY